MKIFISSTFVDLRPERESVQEALSSARIVARAMEFFASEPNSPLDVALRNLDESDAMILIMGFRGGSLVPGSADMTYTSAEFGRAMERQMPVFIFIKTENGEWRNEEAEALLKSALAQFKERVAGSPITPAYFASVETLKYEVLQAITNWSALGRPGARKTFATIDEQFPDARAGALFDYEQTFYGRADEFKALDSFVNADDQIIAILAGRGGIGKSKFLKHWASTIANRSILFLKDSSIWHEDSDKEIPQDPVVLIADDAHHSDNLPALLTCVKSLSEKRSVKLILTTRPSGLAHLDSAIARRFDPGQVIRTRIEALERKDVRSLAEEILGNEYRMYAAALVQISADTPLVTVVGGRLIARGDIATQLLANEEDFRRAVFDKFVEEYEKNLPSSSVTWSSLLRLLAGVQPVRPRQDEFKNIAERFLGKRSDEVLQAIDVLEFHALLLRGGNLVRIVPDVLADYLLERACINDTGEPTGYATALLEHFGSAFFPNILANLAELDWRIGQKYPSTSLLDDAWKEINDAFRTLDASGRTGLLQGLKKAAVFQPERSLELIRFAIKNEAASVERYGVVTSQQDVLNELPPLLQQVSYHFTHFEECVRILFKLAQQDRRPPNPHPEHASRVLKGLASYGLYKPVRFNARIVEMAASLAKEACAFEAEFTPLDIAAELLAKEGEYTDSEGYSVTLGAFTLNFPVIGPVRKKALAIVEECLTSDNPREVKAALSVVADVLRHFLPRYREGPIAEEAEWQDDERISVVEMLAARLSRPSPVALQREILRIVRFVRAKGSGERVIDKARAFFDAIPETDELRIFDALCTNHWDRDYEHGGDFHAAERTHTERIREAVMTFRKLYTDSKIQIEQVKRYLAIAREYEIEARQAATAFVGVLCEDDAFTADLSAFLLADSTPELGYLMLCVLLAFRNKHSDRSEATALLAAVHSNPEVPMAAAQTATSGVNPEDFAAQDARVLAKIVVHPNIWVRRAAFFPLGRLGANPAYRQEAVNLLLKADVGEDEKAADDLFRTFAPSSIDPKTLSESEVAGFLEKLVPVLELDDYWTEQFLGWAVATFPKHVFELLFQRLNHDRGLREDPRYESPRDKYMPVPFADLGATFVAARNTSDYPTVLATVRDRLLTEDIIQRYWLRNLFWSIGTMDDITLHCLDEWLHSNDHQKIDRVVDLLGEGPADAAFARPYFAVHTIECAAELSDALANRAIGSFTVNASKGTITANPGEPPPRFVSAKARAEEVAARFASFSWGRKLFETIAKYSDEMIDKFRLDDDEFRFEH